MDIKDDTLNIDQIGAYCSSLVYVLWIEVCYANRCLDALPTKNPPAHNALRPMQSAININNKFDGT